MTKKVVVRKFRAKMPAGYSDCKCGGYVNRLGGHHCGGCQILHELWVKTNYPELRGGDPAESVVPAR